METKIFGGKKITLSQITAKDLKYISEFTDFINDLIREDAKIRMNIPQTIKHEKDWLKAAVKKIKKREKVYILARDGNKIIANAGIEQAGYRENHQGDFGIIIRKDYRGIGLGKYMMTEVMKLAKKQLKPIPKIFTLEVMANNTPALALYRKMGFKTVGKIPKAIQYKGKLIDKYIMVKSV